jgi:hypothetical protein
METSVRSGVTAGQVNGFILVWESLTGIIKYYLSSPPQILRRRGVELE